MTSTSSSKPGAPKDHRPLRTAHRAEASQSGRKYRPSSALLPWPGPSNVIAL
jgi:hypothetical protein